jgi:hypothetical protein
VINYNVNEDPVWVTVEYEYINDCGDTMLSSATIVILDPEPITLFTSPVGCLDAAGNIELIVEPLSGYGPFYYQWDTAENDTLNDFTYNTSFIPGTATVTVTDICESVTEATISWEILDECGICGGDGSSCVQTCLDDDDAVSAVGGCFNAVDLLGCSFYWDDILISELCPESCNNCPCDNDVNENGVCDDAEVFGCTYLDAVNYNSLATADNGSCEFESTNACLADLDGNGVVATQDLLSFLSLFGEICE